ncbi:MAG: hypothetical protein EOM24_30120 [Chloroflexia bacterium]|nr:hypothetical protein [Chloroflexia bacterium]
MTGTAQPRHASALTSRERTALANAAAKVEQYLRDPSLLQEQDWVILSTLAQRLADLVQHVDQARRPTNRSEP